MARLGVSLSMLALACGAAIAQPLPGPVSGGVVPVAGAPTGFEALTERLMPSVVSITTTATVRDVNLPDIPPGSPLERFNEFFGRDGDGFRREGALGSGFVISPDGLIVTNNHVIEKADEIEIIFSDERRLPARLIGTDPETDIAVLKVESPTPLPYVVFADSDQARVGSWVVAIGNPFGLGGSVSAGIVSARSRNINAGAYDDFIQTDAAINQGNSGGPLFNMKGEVVGVNTAIYSQTGGSVGIGFAVPANLAKEVAAKLKAEGRVRRGWLGVNVQSVDKALATSYGLSSARGVIVTQVTADSPAAGSGVKVGDLILEFDGKIVKDSRDLSRLIAGATIGRPVKLALIRAKAQRTVNVVLTEREGDEQKATADEGPVELTGAANALGVDLVVIDDTHRRRYSIGRSVTGVLVDRVASRGVAAGKLRRGDVIVEMDFQAVPDGKTARAAIDRARTEKRPLLVRVLREGRDAFYSFELK
jgi:serine protease Do